MNRPYVYFNLETAVETYCEGLIVGISGEFQKNFLHRMGEYGFRKFFQNSPQIL